ncbi:hypothetical protein TNCV_4582791 [Trichonephila clavipes]|nr:hypothetical protein TNCV_4582791 [Trichonephila clavipes]
MRRGSLVDYGHKLVARVSRVQALVPLKTCCLKWLIHIISFEVQSPPVSMMWKFGKGVPHQLPRPRYLTEVQNHVRGCGSPVVKVSDPGTHAMSSSSVPLKTGDRAAMHVKSVES